MEETQKILLESGNNEVEMLEFTVSGQSFGINVAKVQTLLQFDPQKVTHLPDAGHELVGHYSLKDQIIPLLNIHHIFNYPPPEIDKKGKESKKIVIVMQFNNIVVAALVDGIATIHRISWDQYVPLNEYCTQPAGLILGSFNKNNIDIMIVDFEKIISDYFPETNIEKVAQKGQILPEEKRKAKKIFHVDDSGTIRMIIKKSMVTANYSNMTQFSDGLEAFNYLEKLSQKEDLASLIDAFIIDIEMPKLDGLTLCKHLRTTFGLPSIPIIMFSSLIDAQMKEKCKSVGATDQITKPEIDNLVKILDKHLSIDQ